MKSEKNKKFLASPYNPKRSWVRRIPEMKNDEQINIEDDQPIIMRPKSKKKATKPSRSPRRAIYEAKFEKYKINKTLKGEYDKEMEQKDDFDLYTKGIDSANAKAKKIDWGTDIFDAALAQSKAKTAADTDDPVYREDYDTKILSTMSHKLESLSKEDRLTFNVLKWIFNAIKKGKHVDKKELIEQLDLNLDIVTSLGFNDMEDVTYKLNTLKTEKFNKLNWEEFLDFFGKSNQFDGLTNEKAGSGSGMASKAQEPVQSKIDPVKRKEELSATAYTKMSKTADGDPVFSEIEEDEKTQANLKKLADSRVSKFVIEEVDDEIAAQKKRKAQKSKQSKAGKRADTSQSIDTIEIFEEKEETAMFQHKSE